MSGLSDGCGVNGGPCTCGKHYDYRDPPTIKKRSLPDQLRYCARSLTDLGGKVPKDCLATVGGVSFLLYQIADDVDAQWLPFDEWDETTWPSEKRNYWCFFPDGDPKVYVTPWLGAANADYWGKVSHWMEIQNPDPPL